MKKYVCLPCFFIGVCIICMGFVSPEHMRTQNRQNLLRLTVDMKKSDALTLMASPAAEDFDTTGTYTLNNPYRSEIIKGKGKVFEVIYYHTDVEQADRILTKKELTPLIFQDNLLIGWGWVFLKSIAEQFEITLEEETA